jgi:hypothetical protein
MNRSAIVCAMWVGAALSMDAGATASPEGDSSSTPAPRSGEAPRPTGAQPLRAEPPTHGGHGSGHGTSPLKKPGETRESAPAGTAGGGTKSRDAAASLRRATTLRSVGPFARGSTGGIRSLQNPQAPGRTSPSSRPVASPGSAGGNAVPAALGRTPVVAALPAASKIAARPVAPMTGVASMTNPRAAAGNSRIGGPYVSGSARLGGPAAGRPTAGSAGGRQIKRKF